MTDPNADRPFVVESRPRDEGFTMVEVVAALMLLSLVAMGALGLFLRGMTSVSDTQRQQVAAGLAASALDRARAVPADPQNLQNTSGLIMGRSQTDVEAVWNEATDRESSDTSDMVMAYDPALGMTEADQWVPVRTTETVGNQTYTVDTLIGECYRLEEASSDAQSCAPPGPTITGYAQLYRVRAVVTWDTGGNPQSYRVSTLVDPSVDVVWNTALLPYAYDIEFDVIAGAAPTSHNLVSGNETVEFGHDNPIVIVSPPDWGSVAANTQIDSRDVWFTPPADASGTVTFRYRLRDAAGQLSIEAGTATVHVLPSPRDDEFTVEPGSVTSINDLLLSNDVGVDNFVPDRVTTIVPTRDTLVDLFTIDDITPEVQAERDADRANLEAAGVTMVGDEVMFTAPGEDDVSVTFYYYLVDSGTGGDPSRFPNRDHPATVTIRTESVPVFTVDADVTLNATATQQWHAIDWRGLTGNADAARIQVESVTGTGGESHVRIDGGGFTSTPANTLEFRTTNGNVGEYTLTYRAVTPGGTVSDETGTLTVTVLPVAPDRNMGQVRRSTETCNWWGGCTQTWTRTTWDLAAGGIGATGLSVVDLGTPTCGTVALQPNGRVQYTSPVRANNAPNITCTFTYRVRTTGDPTLTSQNAGTISVTVVR